MCAFLTTKRVIKFKVEMLVFEGSFKSDVFVEQKLLNEIFGSNKALSQMDVFRYAPTIVKPSSKENIHVLVRGESAFYINQEREMFKSGKVKLSSRDRSFLKKIGIINIKYGGYIERVNLGRFTEYRAIKILK